jgi:hypothetical protein
MNMKSVQAVRRRSSQFEANSRRTYNVVSKSSRIIFVARQQMAAQGCAGSYSDLQSW